MTDCIELTLLEQEILDLEYKINNYVPKSPSVIEEEKNILLNQKLELENQKVYKLNRNIIINDADKLKDLKATGLNFNDENWKDNLKVLVDNNVNLNDPKYKDAIKDIGNKLLESLSNCAKTAFAIQQWVEGIINTIITVISFPINILISFIKQLMDFITTLLGIPLNPLDIPNWAKDVMVKFKELISFILELPTLQGILNLIMKVIDSILPGFSKFIDAVKLLITSLPSSITSLKEFINSQTIVMSKLRYLYEKEKRYLILKINFKKSQLNGSVDKELSKQYELLLSRQRMIVSQLEEIKILSINSSLREELLIQHDKYCKMLTDLEQELKDLEKEIVPKSNEEIQKEIDDLQYRLYHLEEKYSLLFNGEKSITDSKEKLKELEDDNKNLSNICSWNKNIDVVIKLLNSFMEDLKNKTNPYQKQAEFLSKEVILIEEELKKLNDVINNGTSSTEENNLNKQISDINNQIKSIEDDVCATQLDKSFEEINNKLVEIQNLKKLKKDIEQALKNLKLNKDTNAAELEQEKLNLEDRLKTTRELALQSNNQSLLFNTNLNIDLEQFGEVIKWFPTAVNIMCNSPKMIVNIIIAILNVVGSMENLPDIIKLDYV